MNFLENILNKINTAYPRFRIASIKDVSGNCMFGEVNLLKYSNGYISGDYSIYIIANSLEFDKCKLIECVLNVMQLNDVKINMILKNYIFSKFGDDYFFVEFIVNGADEFNFSSCECNPCKC